jgi:nitrogen regulatory protein PII
MKQINALAYHTRSAAVVDVLRDAGLINITLLDLKGTLRPLSESEQECSLQAGLVVISEARISLVCEDADVPKVTDIIPVEQVLPIGGPNS